jgi:hypothetical protein
VKTTPEAARAIGINERAPNAITDATIVRNLD